MVEKNRQDTYNACGCECGCSCDGEMAGRRSGNKYKNEWSYDYISLVQRHSDVAHLTIDPVHNHNIMAQVQLVDIPEINIPPPLLEDGTKAIANTAGDFMYDLKCKSSVQLGTSDEGWMIDDRVVEKRVGPTVCLDGQYGSSYHIFAADMIMRPRDKMSNKRSVLRKIVLQRNYIGRRKGAKTGSFRIEFPASLAEEVQKAFVGITNMLMNANLDEQKKEQDQMMEDSREAGIVEQVLNPPAI